MASIPEKQHYRLNEVCQYTDTQPYVLRFWESEFPQLKPSRSRSGQPVYSRDDVELVLRIKQLLNEDQQTIADVRRFLEREGNGRSGPARARKSAGDARPAPARRSRRKSRSAEGDSDPARSAPSTAPAGADDVETVAKERYDNALEEIAHLKLELNDAQTRLRNAESARSRAESRAEASWRRAQRVVELLEGLIRQLDRPASDA